MHIVQQAHISTVSALELVNKALVVAQQMQIAIAACVVDANGRVKAKVVMEGTSLIADELVEKKARTALLGLPSDQFALAVNATPAIAQSLLQLPEMTLLGGGYPLYQQGVLVGAFAVGGALIEQDMDCAQQVLAQL